MRTFRCSHLPRIMRCPASQVPPKVAIESDNEAGRLGRAVHELLANYAADFTGAGEIPEVAAKHRVKVDDVAPLFYIGKRIWDTDLAPAIMVTSVEQHLQWADGALTGTVDVIGYSEDPPTVIIVDWKTGSPATDHRDQLIGYGKLASVVHPRDTPAKIITVWLREQYFDIEDIGPDEIADWEKRLAHAREHPEIYCPGDACNFCPRAHECEARTALVKSIAKDFLDAPGSAMARSELGAAYLRVKLIRGALESFDTFLKDSIREHGPIPLGDGRQVGFVDIPKRDVDFLKALPVIEEALGSVEAAAPAMKLSLGKLDKIIAAQADKGQKGKDIQAFKDALQEAGAVTVSTHQKLSVMKCAKELP